MTPRRSGEADLGDGLLGVRRIEEVSLRETEGSSEEETWECLALGLRYFTELESWIKILVFSFAAVSLSYETEIEILKFLLLEYRW